MARSKKTRRSTNKSFIKNLQSKSLQSQVALAPSIHRIIDDKETAANGRKYFTFVAQMTHSDEWNYIVVYNNSIDNCSRPFVFDENYLDDMIYLWKRIAIDRVIPLNDTSIIPESLRIISYQVQIDDITSQVLNEYEGNNFHLKMLGVSKLTNEEAIALGLESMKAKQKLISCANFNDEDTRILCKLNDESMIVSLKCL